MAYIPYGYRIERGKAVIDEEARKKILAFIDYYLSGDSLHTATQKAGLSITDSAMNKTLKRGVYLGTDYYPPLLDQETMDKVNQEWQRRYEYFGGSTRRQRKIKGAVPVRERFIVALPSEGIPADAKNDPASKASFLYSCIVSSEKGSQRITASDKRKLIEYGKERVCQ